MNKIDTTGFVLKTTYDTDKSDSEKKISDTAKKVPATSNLAKTAVLNAKITEIESRIPSIAGLVTNSALTAVENKISHVSSLVKKTNYNTKISEIEKKVSAHNDDKYLTTPEFNTLAATIVNARLAQPNLITKTNFNTELKKKIVTEPFQINPNICLLKLNKKTRKFDAVYFRGKNYFDGDDTQNYLVFQSMY